MDNLFFIWHGTPGELALFVEELNALPTSVKLTVHHDHEIINYLDITVYKDRAYKKFQTKIYQKETDRNTILQYNSSHPKYLERGYPSSVTKQAKQWALSLDRNTVLREKQDTVSAKGTLLSSLNGVQSIVPFSECRVAGVQQYCFQRSACICPL
ncbi:hypothetical protein XELAEV_18013245mg [Xenopus laevis]|uniref:Uncharacterized protein n=1 Tax=Xenopus laevis TaxID=8355 RepID=A0A974DP65_XENLA|nr:hypothetical protein XELAEV_18013245mg [Xenopus laevis]